MARGFLTTEEFNNLDNRAKEALQQAKSDISALEEEVASLKALIKNVHDNALAPTTIMTNRSKLEIIHHFTDLK